MNRVRDNSELITINYYYHSHNNKTVSIRFILWNHPPPPMTDIPSQYLRGWEIWKDKERERWRVNCISKLVGHGQTLTVTYNYWLCHPACIERLLIPYHPNGLGFIMVQQIDPLTALFLSKLTSAPRFCWQNHRDYFEINFGLIFIIPLKARSPVLVSR